MKKIYIAQIDDYLASTVEENFYLKNIEKRSTKESGIPYYHLTLADKTGMLSGRIWEQNMDPAAEDLKNTVVRVTGDVLKGNAGQTELIISKIKVATGYQIEDYVFSLEEPLKGKYMRALRKMSEQVNNGVYKELLGIILDKYEGPLREAPLALKGPGSYNGAVLVQIVSVTSIAVQIMRSHNSLVYPQYDQNSVIDPDLVITGSILAAIGDVKRYTPYPDSRRISCTVLLTREMLSIQVIEGCLIGSSIFLSEQERNLLYNMVHAAHDTYGKPMTREASIIHSAYEIYRKLIDMDQIFRKHKGEKGAVFSQEYGSFLYFPNDGEGGENGPAISYT